MHIYICIYFTLNNRHFSIKGKWMVIAYIFYVEQLTFSHKIVMDDHCIYVSSCTIDIFAWNTKGKRMVISYIFRVEQLTYICICIKGKWMVIAYIFRDWWKLLTCIYWSPLPRRYCQMEYKHTVVKLTRVPAGFLVKVATDAVVDSARIGALI